MKKITSISLILGVLATASFANSVQAYNKCIGCHGAKGEKVALGKSKIIKDMTKQEILDALNGYKNGTYGGAMKGLMAGQVKSLSSGDIQAIADLIGK